MEKVQTREDYIKIDSKFVNRAHKMGWASFKIEKARRWVKRRRERERVLASPQLRVKYNNT